MRIFIYLIWKVYHGDFGFFGHLTLSDCLTWKEFIFIFFGIALLCSLLLNLYLDEDKSICLLAEWT